MPVAIFAIALVLRVAFFTAHPRPLRSDEVDYDQLGWTLVKTGTYSTEGHPTAYRAVGYPAVIAAIYAVAGRNPRAVEWTQAIWDSGTALILFALFARRNRRVGLLAGLMWAVLPAALLFSSQLFSESLQAFAIVLFALLMDGVAVPDRRRAWAAGLALGGLLLVRPVLAGVALPFLLLLRRALTTRRVLVVLAWAALPVLLWVARNDVVMHAPVLTTSIGTNLWIGNNPRATGGYSVTNVEAPVTVGLGEVRADAAMGRAAREFIREHPATFLSTGIKKILFLATSEGELVVGRFADAATGSAARFSEKYRSVPARIHILVSLPTALILILGTLGLATRRPDLTGRIFYALLLGILLVTVVFFGGSRFRFPLMPLLTGFAAEFAVEWRARVPAFTRRRLATVAALIGAYLAVWVGEMLLMGVPR